MPDFLDGIEEFLASFSPDEVGVMRTVFRQLLDGRATPPAAVADALGLSPAAVKAALARLVERGMVALDPQTGDIVGARGLSLLETPHRLILAGQYRWLLIPTGVLGVATGFVLYFRERRRCAQLACRMAGSRVTLALLVVASLVVATSIVLDRFPEMTADLLARMARATRGPRAMTWEA